MVGKWHCGVHKRLTCRPRAASTASSGTRAGRISHTCCSGGAEDDHINNGINYLGDILENRTARPELLFVSGAGSAFLLTLGAGWRGRDDSQSG